MMNLDPLSLHSDDKIWKVFKNLHRLDFEKMAVEVLTGMIVDFEAMQQTRNTPLMRRVIQRLRDSGLGIFLVTHLSAVHNDAVLEYYENAKVLGETIVSKVNGKNVNISAQILSTQFDLPTEGLVNVDGYGGKYEKEVWKEMCLPQNIDKFNTTFKKKMLKKEFLLLADILTKAVECRTGSSDTVTTSRYKLMMAIWKGEKINWSAFLFKRMAGEVNKKSHKKGYGFALAVVMETQNVELGKAETIHANKWLGKTKLADAKNAAIARRQKIAEAGESSSDASQPQKKRPMQEIKRAAGKATEDAELESAAAPTKKRAQEKRKRPLRLRCLIDKEDEEEGIQKSPVLKRRRLEISIKKKAVTTTKSVATESQTPSLTDSLTGETEVASESSDDSQPTPESRTKEGHDINIDEEMAAEFLAGQGAHEFETHEPVKEGGRSRDVNLPVEHVSIGDEQTMDPVDAIPLLGEREVAFRNELHLADEFIRFQRWRRFRLSGYPILNNWAAWGEEENWAFRWSGAVNIYQATRKGFGETVLERKKREIIEARNHKMSTTGAGETSKPIAKNVGADEERIDEQLQSNIQAAFEISLKETKAHVESQTRDVVAERNAVESTVEVQLEPAPTTAFTADVSMNMLFSEEVATRGERSLEFTQAAEEQDKEERAVKSLLSTMDKDGDEDIIANEGASDDSDGNKRDTDQGGEGIPEHTVVAESESSTKLKQKKEKRMSDDEKRRMSQTLGLFSLHQSQTNPTEEPEEINVDIRGAEGSSSSNHRDEQLRNTLMNIYQAHVLTQAGLKETDDKLDKMKDAISIGILEVVTVAKRASEEARSHRDAYVEMEGRFQMDLKNRFETEQIKHNQRDVKIEGSLTDIKSEIAKVTEAVNNENKLVKERVEDLEKQMDINAQLTQERLNNMAAEQKKISDLLRTFLSREEDKMGEESKKRKQAEEPENNQIRKDHEEFQQALMDAETELAAQIAESHSRLSKFFSSQEENSQSPPREVREDPPSSSWSKLSYMGQECEVDPEAVEELVREGWSIAKAIDYLQKTAEGRRRSEK